MTIKINFSYFDKLFKLTKSTPVDFYKFMKLGVREGMFPCHIKGYMDKFYIEDECATYAEAAMADAWVILSRKKLPAYDEEYLDSHIKSLIVVPPIIEVTLDGTANKITKNSSVYFNYRMNAELRKELDQKFIEHYKLTEEEITE